MILSHHLHVGLQLFFLYSCIYPVTSADPLSSLLACCASGNHLSERISHGCIFMFHVCNLTKLPTSSTNTAASCSLSLLVLSSPLLLSGRAFQMREVLGIPTEWTLHFPDQMTVASVWTAANNNCLFFPSFPTSSFKTLPLPPLPTRSHLVWAICQRGSKTTRQTQSGWFILSYLEHIYVAHMGCTHRFLSGTIWQRTGKVRLTISQSRWRPT